MIRQVDVWMDNAMYKDDTVFWETTWQAVQYSSIQTKDGGLELDAKGDVNK